MFKKSKIGIINLDT